MIVRVQTLGHTYYLADPVVKTDACLGTLLEGWWSEAEQLAGLWQEHGAFRLESCDEWEFVG